MELPDNRKAIHGKSQRELYEAHRNSGRPDGPYRRRHGERPVLVAVIIVICALLLVAIVIASMPWVGGP